MPKSHERPGMYAPQDTVSTHDGDTVEEVVPGELEMQRPQEGQKLPGAQRSGGVQRTQEVKQQLEARQRQRAQQQQKAQQQWGEAWRNRQGLKHDTVRQPNEYQAYAPRFGTLPKQVISVETDEGVGSGQSRNGAFDHSTRSPEHQELFLGGERSYPFRPASKHAPSQSLQIHSADPTNSRGRPHVDTDVDNGRNSPHHNPTLPDAPVELPATPLSPSATPPQSPHLRISAYYQSIRTWKFPHVDGFPNTATDSQQTTTSLAPIQSTATSADTVQNRPVSTSSAATDSTLDMIIKHFIA